MIFDIDGVEESIGYKFKDKMLLRQCFTHASYANEHGESDNELLEFFGDSIIEFVVTEYLFKNSYGNEGDLTKKRAELVSKDPLLKAVKKMGLHEFVLLGRGQGKAKNLDEKLFSSIYEAVVAGIYVDGGITAAKKFITQTIIADYLAESKKKVKKTVEKDKKSEFQEYVQKNKLGSITYETLWKKGPDHLPEFRVAAMLNGSRLAEGIGSSKKNAESEAAKVALQRLKAQGGRKK